MTETVTASFCAPCEAQAHQAATRAQQESYMDTALRAEAVTLAEESTIVDEAPAASPTQARWAGPLGFEGQYTGDGRYINPGALRTDPAIMPIPLRYSPEGNHDAAFVVGLIESVTATEGGALWGEGFIDTTSTYGTEAYNGMLNKTVRGVSMDLDDIDYQVYVRSELVAELNALLEGDEPEAAEKNDSDVEGYDKVAEGATDDQIMRITDGRIRAATLVAIPAFAEALLDLVASTGATLDAELNDLVAAAPLAPPTRWFQNPNLSGPTALTFSDDGMVYGHIALWGTCHTGYAQCITPPRSAANYSWFRTGVIRTDEGYDMTVGHITMDTGHASPNMSAAASLAHYDDTGTCVADVAAGEDEHGIWVSGSLRSDITPEQLRALRAAPMSGDWRRIGGNLELLAILAVNVPGFPVPRPRALVASGSTQTLQLPIDTSSEVMPTNDGSTERNYPLVERFHALSARIRREQWAKKVNSGE